MKILNIFAACALTIGAGLSACGTSLSPPKDDDPALDETTSEEVQNCCAAVDNCIDTAQRDGNRWLIPQCCANLSSCCPSCGS